MTHPLDAPDCRTPEQKHDAALLRRSTELVTRMSVGTSASSGSLLAAKATLLAGLLIAEAVREAAQFIEEC